MNTEKNDALKSPKTLWKVLGYLSIFFLIATPILAAAFASYPYDTGEAKTILIGRTTGNTNYEWATEFSYTNGADITDFSVWVAKTGTPTDNLKVELCELGTWSGNPCGNIEATLNISGSSLSSSSFTKKTLSGLNITLNAGTTYLLYFSRSGGTDGSNYYKAGLWVDDENGNFPYNNRSNDSGSWYDWNEGGWGCSYECGIAYELEGNETPPPSPSPLTTWITSASGTSITVGGTCAVTNDPTKYFCNEGDTENPCTKITPSPYTMTLGKDGIDWIARTDQACGANPAAISQTFTDLASGTWNVGTKMYSNNTTYVSFAEFVIFQEGGTTGSPTSPTPPIYYGDPFEQGICNDTDPDANAFIQITCGIYTGITQKPPFLWIGQLKTSFEEGWYGDSQSLNLTLSDPNGIFSDIEIFDSSTSNTGITGMMNTNFPDWDTWMKWAIYGAGLLYIYRIPGRFLRNLNPEDAP